MPSKPDVPRRSPRPVDPRLRERVLLAEQSAETGVKVVPGDAWAWHYPAGPEKRQELLTRLLGGSAVPDNAVQILKPDALVYSMRDLEQHPDVACAQVRNLTAKVANFDYQRFAEFVAHMHGRGLTLAQVESLYESVNATRTQQKLHDAYGHTGRQDIAVALKDDMARTVSPHAPLRGGVQTVFDALRVDWASRSMAALSTEQRDQYIARLNAEERASFETLHTDYSKYVQTGDSDALRSLTKQITQVHPRKPGSASKEMQKLEKELEPYQDDVGMPGTADDPAIPPDDRDEYITPPPPAPGETAEQVAQKPIFEITPAGTSVVPVTGYFRSGSKSYYDRAQKTWSKKKQLQPYTAHITPTERGRISGAIDTGLKSLPLPLGYAPDRASLTASHGASVQLHHDQNGCYYVQADRPCSISVEFAKAGMLPQSPIPEDSEEMMTQSLSPKTEMMMQSLHGTTLQKAIQIRDFVHASHFYPGGGDLQQAQGLQHKLRTESSPDQYIGALDASEYLECYSANTLFAAMARRAGIATRLVVGHHVEGARDGKAAITASTGHAWCEVWTGREWKRIDATPPAKPDDKKKDDPAQSGAPTPSKQADDGGVDQPSAAQQSQNQSQNEGQEGSEGKPSSKASDSDVQKGESQLSQDKSQMQEMQEAQQQVSEQIQNAQSFDELQQAEQRMQEEQLLDEMKQDLQDRIEAKKDEMKEEAQEKLEQMRDDGFIDDAQHDAWKEALDQQDERLQDLMRQIERETRLYTEYDAVRESVMPLVEEWFQYFVEHLPREQEVDTDEDSLTRQGAFNRHSVQRYRNLLFGTVKNPRVIRSSLRPRFMASLVIDVSGSMGGPNLHSARRLLVFFSELFALISQKFGYIRFSMYAFSDGISLIKSFDQKYDSSERYRYDDGKQATVKVRLMHAVRAQGGTDMLPALQRAACDLSEQTYEYPDFASALYFTGDGGDTTGNTRRIREFLTNTDSTRGFGNHLLSAVMLGDESQRRVLAELFGDEHTHVAPTDAAVIEKHMLQFATDIEAYLESINVIS